MSSSSFHWVEAIVAAAALAVAGCGEAFVTSTGAGGGGASAGTGGATSTSASTGGHGGAGGTGGMGSSGSTGGSAPTCAGPGEACGDCLAAQCPELYCPCVGNSACEKLADCYDDCPPDDPLWEQYCRGLNPSAISKLALISHCKITECSSKCGGTGQAMDPCTLCVYTSCADKVNACLGDSACAKAADCISKCPPMDTSCVDGCEQQHPGGAIKLAAMRMCQQDKCGASCM